MKSKTSSTEKLLQFLKSECTSEELAAWQLIVKSGDAKANLAEIKRLAAKYL